MTKEELKGKLSKYSKDEIIEGILSNSWRRDFAESLLISLKDNVRHKAYKEQDDLADRELKAMESFFSKQKAYNAYLFDVARRHGIVHKNEKGQDSYKWGDWFDTATQAEKDEALRLERAQGKAYDDWKALERKLEASRKKAERLYQGSLL